MICSLLPDKKEVEIIDTSNLNIAHCVGCNQCWLKTPGVCAFKDDYEGILKKLVRAENLWLVSDTRFGFLDYKGKRMMDRLFAQNGNFLTPEAAKFVGVEQYPWLVRKMVSLLFLKKVNGEFEQFAKDWGCTRPLDDKPYNGL